LFRSLALIDPRGQRIEYGWKIADLDVLINMKQDVSSARWKPDSRSR
jgi:hypothetical protein